MYLPTLDGLRFFAFLLVFLHHLPASPNAALARLQSVGWVGVHLFLLLSALLLARLLREEHRRTGSLAIGRFYLRRGLRIWPLYVVFVAAVGSWAALRGAWTTEHTTRALGLATFTDNIFAALDGYNPFPFAAHLWTLSLEEQFYLLLPWIVGASAGDVRALRRGLLALWGLFVAARIACVGAGAPHPAIWVSIFSGDALLFGTALGASGVSIAPRADRVVVLLGLLLLLAVPLAAPAVHLVGAHQVGVYTSVALGAGAICVAATRAPWLAWLGARPLRALGRISYGLYVFHLLGVRVATALVPSSWTPVAWWGHAAVALALTVAAAGTSYAALERPFLRLKARFEVVRSREA